MSCKCKPDEQLILADNTSDVVLSYSRKHIFSMCEAIFETRKILNIESKKCIFDKDKKLKIQSKLSNLKNQEAIESSSSWLDPWKKTYNILRCKMLLSKIDGLMEVYDQITEIILECEFIYLCGQDMKDFLDEYATELADEIEELMREYELSC